MAEVDTIIDTTQLPPAASDAPQVVLPRPAMLPAPPSGYEWFDVVVQQITGYRDELHAPDGALAQMRDGIVETQKILARHVEHEATNWEFVRRELAATRADVQRVVESLDRLRIHTDAELARVNGRVDEIEDRLGELTACLEGLKRGQAVSPDAE